MLCHLIDVLAQDDSDIVGELTPRTFCSRASQQVMPYLILYDEDGTVRLLETRPGSTVLARTAYLPDNPAQDYEVRRHRGSLDYFVQSKELAYYEWCEDAMAPTCLSAPPSARSPTGAPRDLMPSLTALSTDVHLNEVWLAWAVECFFLEFVVWWSCCVNQDSQPQEIESTMPAAAGEIGDVNDDLVRALQGATEIHGQDAGDLAGLAPQGLRAPNPPANPDMGSK